MQTVAIVRVTAELAANAALWQRLAAGLWLLALLPWVLRNAWIYLRPRADGRSG